MDFLLVSAPYILLFSWWGGGACVTAGLVAACTPYYKATKGLLLTGIVLLAFPWVILYTLLLLWTNFG